MDHFALPADDLGRAVERGELHRNFMGYPVQKTPDLVAGGAVDRGYELSPDDLLRRHAIGGLRCNFRVDVRDSRTV